MLSEQVREIGNTRPGRAFQHHFKSLVNQIFIFVAMMMFNHSILPDDVLTIIVELLSIKDLSRYDTAICNLEFRRRYLSILSHALISATVPQPTYSKDFGSHFFNWAFMRNVRLRELLLVGGNDAFDPTGCPLLRNLTTLTWANYQCEFATSWKRISAWQLCNITSLSFHSKLGYELHNIIYDIAVRCPNLQILKMRCVGSISYHNKSCIDSISCLFERCPQLHSLFLWNILVEETNDLQALKQSGKLVLFAEASNRQLQSIYSEKEYEQDLSRVFIQEKAFYWGNSPHNRKALGISWKGLSTHTMGEYIAEVVPDMKILNTTCYSDCKFALPVLIQCRNISSVQLNNCLHLTLEMVMLIVTLPHLYYLELENNSTLSQLIPMGAKVMCEAVEIRIIRFSHLTDANVEYFVQCCPRMRKQYSQIRK